MLSIQCRAWACNSSPIPTHLEFPPASNFGRGDVLRYSLSDVYSKR